MTAAGAIVSHAARNRIYLAIIAALVLVIAAMAYKFMIPGTVESSDDGRATIVLEPGERALMLREMREFVAGLRTISAALARDDMPGVAKAARAMGTVKSGEVPAAMLGKLPIEFKTLAQDVHRGFDTIAADAEGGATSKQTLARIGDVLQNCAACHASFQVRTPADR